MLSKCHEIFTTEPKLARITDQFLKEIKVYSLLPPSSDLPNSR
jgi:hypothetical protein